MSAVEHPAHYGGDTTYEAIKVIQAWKLNFSLGSVVKYICRVDAKGDAIENLQKAREYIDFEINERAAMRGMAPEWVSRKTDDELVAQYVNLGAELHERGFDVRRQMPAYKGTM
jgi:hypothetical protein